MTKMSATVRELVDEAYNRREQTWVAALETVNNWVTTSCSEFVGPGADRVRVTSGRIKDPTHTGEKLRRKLADSNDEIHESVQVEHEVIDIVGTRIICRTEREQAAVFDRLSTSVGNTDMSIAEVRDYSQRPKPSGYRGRHLIIEVPFAGEPSVLVEMQIRTVLQEAWSTLVEELAFKPGQALKSDVHRDQLSLILSGLLKEADAVAGYLADDLAISLGPPVSATSSSLSPHEGTPPSTATADKAIDVTVRELKHSYVLAADEVGRYGIIRFDSLGLTPENEDHSKLPVPGDTFRVRTDETPTTRYFIPVSD